MLGLRKRCIHKVLAAAFVLSGAAATAAIAQDMTPSFMSMPPPAQFAAVPAPNPPAPPAQTNPQPAQADPQPGQATPPPADVNQQPAPAQPPAAQKLGNAQVDQLVAPVALYPDPILSQMLMASTYPLEVVEAAHWVQDPSHKSLTGDALTAALKGQNWDPSVMALVPFPRVLALMGDQVQWTEQLGNAFLAQQNDVMASVQRLRHAALAAGNLKATPECHCIIQTSGDQIAILPAEPKVVCIPVYNPRYVYGAWWEPDYPPIAFPPPAGFAYAPGYWIGFEPPIEVAVFGPLWGWGWFDWPGRRIVVDNVVFGRLEPNHATFAGGAWIHDPAHRRGVIYAGTAASARFGGGQRPANIAITRGAPAVIGNRIGAPAAIGRFGGVHPAAAFATPQRSFAGRAGPGAIHSGNFAHSAPPQFARGHTAPAHFSPGGHGMIAQAHGPAGGPHGGGPGEHHH